MGASAILSNIILDKKSGWGKNRARKINSVYGRKQLHLQYCPASEEKPETFT